MYHYSKRLLFRFLKKLGIGLIRFDDLEVLKKQKMFAEKAEFDFRFLKILQEEERDLLLAWREFSKAQLSQDIFVAMKLNLLRGGYFIEIGAADGLYCSNTYMLEKNLGWAGIVVEPAKSWQKELLRNRSCAIELSAIGGENIAETKFFEAESPNLSTLSSLHDFDGGGKSRKKFREYFVQQMTLSHLLLKHNAPKIIDYLSLDVEGNELAILSNFDFSQYDIKIITYEHNFNSNKSTIHNLLLSNGFKEIFAEVSDFDGWYLNTKYFR